MRGHIWGVVAVAAALAGCGGDDDSAALGAGEYTQQANAICAKLKREQLEVFKDLDSKDRDAMIEATREAGERTQAALEELEDLDGPDATEAQVERLVDKSRALGDTAKDADPDALRKAQAEIAELAKDAGLTDCVG